VVVVISLLAVLALYLSGTALLSLTSSTESSPSGSMTVAEFQVHWPLLALCAAGLAGLIGLAWPQRRPPRL
jgi:hypothetical protein